MQNINEFSESQKLIDKAVAWVEQKDWKKIIDEIGALNPEGMPSGLSIILANAYIAEAYKNNNRPLYEKAIYTLTPLADILVDDLQFNRIMGIAFFHLDLYGYAIDFLNKAMKLIPKGQAQLKRNLKEVSDLCNRYLSIPYFEKNFKERVKDVWREFEKNEGDFRKQLDEPLDEDEREELHIKCVEILRKASPNFFCFMEKKDTKYSLILTSFGKLMPLYEALYLKQYAPQSVSDKWEIQIGIPKDFFYKVPEFPHFDNELMFEFKTDRHEVFKLLPFSKKIPLPLLYAPTFTLPLIDNVVINEVGEVVFAKFIDLPKEPEPHMPSDLDGYSPWIFSLSKLAGFLEKLGLEVNATSQFLLDRFVKYSRGSKSGRNYEGFRKDIVSGKTRCIKFIKDCNMGKQNDMNELESDGVAAGYFCYRKDHFAEQNKRRESLLFNENFRHQLIQKVGEENVKILGSAYGKYFDYVDVLIFDLPKVLLAAKDIFQSSKVPFGGFHVFRKNAGTVLLAGDVFWSLGNPKHEPSTRLYGFDQDPDGRFVCYEVDKK